MSQFLPAFDYIMGYEDPMRAYEEIVDNNGGRVISGINSKSYPNDESFISSLPQSQRGDAVNRFYSVRFWTPMQLGGIASQDVANRALDMGVNAGPRTAIKLLQEAVNLIKPRELTEDGAIGPATLAAVNAQDEDSLLAAFRSVRLTHYQEIAANDPSQQRYLGTQQNPGPWWKRAIA